MVMVFKSAATLEFIFPVSQSYFIGQLKLLGFGFFFFLANDQNYISNNKADFCDAFSLLIGAISILFFSCQISGC